MKDSRKLIFPKLENAEMCVSATVKINNLFCFNFHPFVLLEMFRHCFPELISHNETNFTYKTTSIDVDL